MTQEVEVVRAEGAATAGGDGLTVGRRRAAKFARVTTCLLHFVLTNHVLTYILLA